MGIWATDFKIGPALGHLAGVVGHPRASVVEGQWIERNLVREALCKAGTVAPDLLAWSVGVAEPGGGKDEQVQGTWLRLIEWAGAKTAFVHTIEGATRCGPAQVVANARGSLRSAMPSHRPGMG